MPLFFFLSGLVFNKNKYATFKEFFIKKIRTLFIPYCIFSVLTWVVWVLYNILFHNSVDSYFYPLLQTLLSQGSGGYIVHNTPLWYVTCLICVESIYFFIAKIKSPILRTCIILALTSIGLILIQPNSPLRHAIWSLDMALCAILFYSLGHFAREYRFSQQIDNFFKNPRMYTISIYLGILIQIVGAILNPGVSMGHRFLNNIVLFYLFGVTGTFTVILFSKFLSKYDNCITNFIMWLGENSFYVMALQVPVKGFLIAIIARMVHTSTDYISSNYLYGVIVFVITLFIVTVGVHLINLIKSVVLNRRIK